MTNLFRIALLIAMDAILFMSSVVQFLAGIGALCVGLNAQRDHFTSIGVGAGVVLLLSSITTYIVGGFLYSIVNVNLKD